MRAVLGLPAPTPYISCFHETLKNMTNPQALTLLTPLCVHLDSPCGFNTDTPQVSPLPKCGPGEPSDSSFQELMAPRTFQPLRPQTGGCSPPPGSAALPHTDPALSQDTCWLFQNSLLTPIRNRSVSFASSRVGARATHPPTLPILGFRVQLFS